MTSPFRDRVAMPKFIADVENALSKTERPTFAANGRVYKTNPDGSVVDVTNGHEDIPEYAKPALAEYTHRQEVYGPGETAGYAVDGNSNDFVRAVNEECAALAQMLITKNAKYGNSALNPVRVFSDAHPMEQILVRIDDKLSRIRNGNWGQGEDTTFDLMGYLVLLRLAHRGIR